MATYNQISSLPIIGADVPFKNYSLSTIPSGTAVLFDGTNKGDVNNAAGIVVPTASGGVAKTAGVTIEAIPSLGTGRVRMLGGAVAVANATMNPGDLIQIDDASSHMGEVKVATSTNEILGKCLSAAVAGDPVLIWVNVTAHN